MSSGYRSSEKMSGGVPVQRYSAGYGGGGYGMGSVSTPTQSVPSGMHRTGPVLAGSAVNGETPARTPFVSGQTKAQLKGTKSRSMLFFASSVLLFFAGLMYAADEPNGLWEPVRPQHRTDPLGERGYSSSGSHSCGSSGEHETLAQVIKYWLHAHDVDEVILVDWSSDPPLSSTLRKIHDPRFALVRVENEESWVLSRAYNIGMSFATKDKILKLDCDYGIHPDFVKKHKLRKEDKIFYSGDYGKARNENEIHLNGVLYIRSEDFWGIFGYDERIQTYGWDDEDLYMRLDHRGLKRTVVNYDLVLHYPHGDTSRGQKGVKFPQVLESNPQRNPIQKALGLLWQMESAKSAIDDLGFGIRFSDSRTPTFFFNGKVEVDVNSLLLDKMDKWSKTTGPDCSKYHVASTKPGQIILQASSTPQSLQKRNNKEVVDEAFNMALGRRLHDEYKIPWDVLLDLELVDRDLLLGDFITLSGKTGMGDVVRAKGIFLDVVGNCLQRIVSVVYGLTFAKASKRTLMIVWSEENCAAAFTDIFDKFVATAPQMRTKYPFTNAATWDGAFESLTGVDLVENKGDQAKLATTDPEMNLYIKTKRFTYKTQELERVLLSAEVLAEVGALGTTGMIGVVAIANEDYMLLKSAVEEEQKKSPGTKIFVVTQDESVIRALSKPKVGKSMEACAEAASKQCGIASAVDVGALAATSVIVARAGSDFALAARGLSDVPLRLI